MNRPNVHVVEANISVVEVFCSDQFGRGNYTPAQRREMDDITQWLEEQDEAEVEFLVAEMVNKSHRAYRRSMSY